MRDDAEVLFELLCGHADAVVGDRQRALFLVRGDLDVEIVAALADLIVGQGAEIKLVDRVGCVGD